MKGFFSFNATIQAIKTDAVGGPYYSYCNWAGIKIESTSSCYLTSRRPSWIDEGDVIISALVIGI